MEVLHIMYQAAHQTVRRVAAVLRLLVLMLVRIRCQVVTAVLELHQAYLALP